MDSRLADYRDQATARARLPHESPKVGNWTRAFFELYADRPLAERQARSMAYALANEPVYVFPLERLAGQIYQACPGAESPEVSGSSTDPRWAEFTVCDNYRVAVDHAFTGSDPTEKNFGGMAAPGHVTWDFGKLLHLGVEGMFDEIAQRRIDLEADARAVEFYDCASIVLEGFIIWVKRHVETLRALAADEADILRRTELLDMAAICERVPAKPASTFREAVQSFLLQHLAVMFENPFGGNGPGRLDWFLWPYLKADLEAGRTSEDEARELMTELMIKLDERIHDADGWVEAIMVGGRNPDGSLSINPLSYMIVESMIELKNTHPSVYMRVPDDSPKQFLDLAARYMIESENRGQVYGDDAIIRALVEDGTDIEDARHWAAGGCMEVGVQGASGDLLFAFAFNMAQTLELVLNGGKRLGSDTTMAPIETTLDDYASFDQLYDAFQAELKREVAILMRHLDISLGCYAKYRPAFLLSTMVNGCLSSGRAINDGGARYPHYGGSGVGIPNVGDSLYAIKRAVYDDKKYTGAELLEALRANYEGCTEMHTYLRNLPKYGSGSNDEVVRLVDRVLLDFTHSLKNHVNPASGHCRPIILGFVWVVSFGLETGATADGRTAGTPLAHGLSPQCGSATNGITASIGDATSLSLHEIPGGASMMWDIDHSWAKPDIVRPVLETYINEGGHIFQGNILSVDRLIEAQKHPDAHRDLMVRVGGYSARFCTLSKESQDEIISRRKYSG